MRIPCNIITSEVRELAKQLNLSDNRAVNLITYWQSTQGGDSKGRYPSKEELQEFKKQVDSQIEEISIALPEFVVDRDQQERVSYKQGIIHLTPFSEEFEFEAFLSDSDISKEVIDLVNSDIKKAHAFILYRQMAVVQNNLSNSKEDLNKADKLALTKLKAKIAYDSRQNYTKEDLTTATPIEYTPKGKQRQKYFIKGNKIFNKKGDEVFKGDSVDRNKIFANLAVQEGRAVVVQYQGSNYVVNKKGQIVSGTTGKIMQWGEENGDRKNILNIASIKFNLKEGIGKGTKENNSKLETFSGNWSREEVAKQTDKVFLFGDNTNDRVNTHYVPSMTQAVIRGLPNAIGIDTKKNRGTAESSYFTDADFDTFKAQVDGAIQQAVNSGKTIVIPEGGIGTGKAQLQQRAPKLFNYLQEQLNKLQQGEITQKNTNEEYSLVESANKELLEVLGNDSNAQNEIKDVVKTVKKGISFDEALKGVESIFTKEEIEQIKQGLNGKRLQVLSVSRQTDPAFFSKEIIKFLEENSKKSLSDPTRTNVIEIWSKHDGVPIQDILKACKKYKVAPMVSFSITGLGDTALEKGVLKYQDLIPLIGQLIESGDLNPQTTTIRIDPILVGETNMDDIKKIVQSCKDLGIKKFVTSLVQSYGYLDGTAKDRKVTSGINNALASEGRSYDWDKYYGKDSRGRINFKPKQQYIDEIGKELLELNKDPEIEIETCSFLIKGLKASACLDPLIIERITGISVTRSDGTYDRDTSRPDCMCYGAHSDMFRVNEKKCFSSCAYCYAGHSNDSNFKYYNEDGTLVDRPLTKVNKSYGTDTYNAQTAPNHAHILQKLINEEAKLKSAINKKALLRNAEERAIVAEYAEKQISSRNLEIGTNYDTSIVKDLFNEFNSDKELSILFNKVVKLAESNNINIKFDDLKSEKGNYNGYNEVIYDIKLFNNPNTYTLNRQDKARVLLHELIHSITTYAINEVYSDESLLNPSALNSARNIIEVYNSIKDDELFKGEYGISNPREMIAELANKSFTDKLKQKSLWKKLIDNIAKLFGIEIENSNKTTAYDELRNALEDLIDNFDKTQYNIYNKVNLITKSLTTNTPLSKATEKKILKYHGYFEGGGATLNTVPTDLINDVAGYFMGDSLLSEERAQEFLQYVSIDPNQYSLYSGDATGSDTVWGKTAENYSIPNITHYRPEDVNKDNRQEAINKINEANKHLDRVFPVEAREATETKKARSQKEADYINNLILRDTFQVSSADAIYAIGQIKGRPDSDGIIHMSQVDGGTGWAVQIGINEGKPVYVYDQKRKQWYKNEGKPENRKFIPLEEAPKLTFNFAGVGTRNINDEGRKAIQDVFTNTFGYVAKNKSTQAFGRSLFSEEDLGQEEDLDFGTFSSSGNLFGDIDSGDDIVQEEKSLPRPNIKSEDVLQAVEDEAYQAYMTFTPQTLENRANMLYQLFDEVTDTLLEEAIDQLNEDLESSNDPEEIYQIYAKLESLEDEEKGKENLIATTPFTVLCDRVKERLQEEFEDADSDYDSAEYQKVIDNFDYVMEKACRIIEQRLNVRIVTKKIKNAEGKTVLSGSYTKNLTDQEIAETEFSDNPEGKRVTGNDGWSTEIKMLNPLTAASRITKSILYSIPEHGIDAHDDLGWTRYMDGGLVHTVLLNNLSSMLDADSWYNPNGNTIRQKFPALAKLEVQYPYVINIMNRLHGDEQAISAMYSDLFKTFSKQVKLKGNSLMTLNDPSVVTSVIDTVSDLYDSRKQVNGQKTLWDKTGKYRKEVLQEIQSTLPKIQLSNPIEDSEQRREYAALINDILKSIGIITKKQTINNSLKDEEGITKVRDSLSNISTLVDTILKNPDKDSHLITDYKTIYTNLANSIGDIASLKYRVTFREGGKDYPSYVAPSEIDIMFKKLTNKNKEQRLQYIENNFKDSGFFYDPSTGTYNNKILQDLIDRPKVLENIETVTCRHQDTPDDPSTTYNDWTEQDVQNLQWYSYFTKDNPKDQTHFSFFNFPIFSDSEAAMLVKLPSYRTTKKSTFKDKLIPLFRKVVEQELHRINLVEQRRKDPSINKIVNFDKHGDRFFFFPHLNYYQVPTENEEGQIAYVPFIDMIKQLKSNPNASYGAVEQLIDKAVEDILKSECDNYIDQFSEDAQESMVRNAMVGRHGEEKRLDIEKILNNPQEAPSYIKETMEEFFWNYYYAQSQIIQLVATDLAFYKDDNGVDFQKRSKQSYASGNRLNTNSKNGRKMSYNIVVADKIVVSSSYTEIDKGLQKLVDRKWISQEHKDNLMQGYLEINAADGQALRSRSSFKAFLEMSGQLTPALEQSLDRFEQGEPTKKDFLTVLQVVKPFAYGSILQNDGMGGQMRVGHQFKNSEAPLLAGLSIVAQSVLGESSFLNAIDEFMEAHQIDTMQFESCVKTGGQGIIDLHFSNKKLQTFISKNPSSWQAIKEAYNNKYGTLETSDREIYVKGNIELLKDGKISQEEFNDRQYYTEPSKREILDILEDTIIEKDYDNTIERNDPDYIKRFRDGTVVVMPYENYMIAQPTPEHLFDTYAKIGSQISNIITADLPKDFKLKLGDIELDRTQLKTLYDAIHVENRLDAYLNVQEQYKDPESLSQTLLSKVQGNPKYGRLIEDALRVIDDPNNPGKKIFNTGFDLPSIKSQIEELMLSTFKSKVTTQEITGGNAVLTSSFAFTKKLKVEFDENGGIKRAQCYLPAHSRKFYEPFMDENGIIKMEDVPVELRRMISYRIPTEGKYSSLPLEVVGFLPPIYGSTIMLPVDISYIAGEDYDVDKRFLMIPAFRLINKYNYKYAEQEFLNQHPQYKDRIKEEKRAQFNQFLEEYKKAQETDPTLENKLNDKETYLEWLKGQKTRKLEWLQEVQEAWQKWFKQNKHKYIKEKKAVKVKMDLSALKDPSFDSILETIKNSDRQGRDNLLIDIMYGILSHPDIAPQVLNPGNYEQLKRVSKIGTILSDPLIRNRYQDENYVDDNNIYDNIQQKTTKELVKLVSKYQDIRSPLNPNTFVYNHQQNMTSGKLIGNYANNTTAQTKLQDTNIGIQPWFQIQINNRLISSVSEMLTGVLPDGTRQLISKNCSETSAASVDDVKDPNLRDLQQKPKTAKILGGALRAGMTMDEAGLLFRIPEVTYYIQQKGQLRQQDIDTLVERAYARYMGTEDANIKDIRRWYYQNKGIVSISTQDIVQCITRNASLETQFRIMYAMSNIIAFTDHLGGLTMNSRQDSPNGSIAHTLSGALKQIINIDKIHQDSHNKGYSLTNVRQDFIKNGLLENLSTERSNKDAIRRTLMENSMRRQQSAYSLGIELPFELVSQYFAVANTELVNIIKEYAQFRNMTDYDINDIQSGFLDYLFTKTDLFGDAQEGSLLYKEAYYTSEFPKKAMQIIESIPELSDNPTISMLVVGNNGNIQLRDSARLSESQKQQHTNNLDMLLRSNNPKVVEFAEDLFLHAFFTTKLQFGPHSFGNLFSMQFINSFPEVRDFFRYLKDNTSIKDVYGYLQQLTANTKSYGSLLPLQRIGKKQYDPEEGICYVPKKSLDYKNYKGEPIQPSQMVIYYNEEYAYGQEEEEDFVTMTAQLDTEASNENNEYYVYREYDSAGFKYNARKTVEELIEDSRTGNEDLKKEIEQRIKDYEEQYAYEEDSLKNQELDNTTDPYSIEEGQQVLRDNGEKEFC